MNEFLDFAFEVRIPHDHPSLAGHFPGRPVVPAVVILDHIENHLCSSIATRTNSEQREYRIERIVNARFQSPLMPGERLAVSAKLDLATLRANVEAKVDSRGIATATFVFVPVSSQSTPQ